METVDGFRGEYSFLSNFYLLENPMQYGTLSFPTVEHFYQAMKFEDQDIRKRVAEHPSKGLKKYISAMDIYIREDWDYMKLYVMYYGLTYKFSDNNPKLKGRLLNTGDTKLVEYNWWG